MTNSTRTQTAALLSLWLSGPSERQFAGDDAVSFKILYIKDLINLIPLTKVHEMSITTAPRFAELDKSVKTFRTFHTIPSSFNATATKWLA